VLTVLAFSFCIPHLSLSISTTNLTLVTLQFLFGLTRSAYVYLSAGFGFLILHLRKEDCLGNGFYDLDLANSTGGTTRPSSVCISTTS